MLKILSLDPSLTNLGWAFSKFNLDTGVMQVMKFGSFKSTYTAKKLQKKETPYQAFNTRIVAIGLLRNTIDELVTVNKPTHVVTESPFVHRHPSAYGALMSCLTTVEFLLFKKHGMPLHRIPPCSAKLLITGNGHSGKEIVQDAILNSEKIDIRSSAERVKKMNKDESDAISIGYAFALSYEK